MSVILRCACNLWRGCCHPPQPNCPATISPFPLFSPHLFFSCFAPVLPVVQGSSDEWVRAMAVSLQACVCRPLQVTPAELGARLFPRLRLEKVQDDDYVSVQTDMLPLHTSGTMDRLHVETVHRKSLSCASSVGAPNFNKHPLVQDGKVSAAELKAQHEACCTSINTLLGTTPPTFRENTFRFLGNHFQVPYHGSGGLERKMFINGLAMRVVPSIIQQKATASEPLNDCTPEAPERPVSQDAGVVPPHHLGTVVPPHHVGPSLGRS